MILKRKIREATEEASVRQDRRVPSFPTLLGHPMLLSGARAVADQALISGANFFTTVMVARAVAPALFGKFVLAYTALWFFQNIQGALITEPMSVLGAKKEGDDYRRYVTSTAALQAIFVVLVASALLLSAALASPLRSLLFALAFAVFCRQLLEFVRRVFYTRTDVGAALTIDVMSYGGQVVLLTVLYSQGALTPVSALLAVAIASGAAAAVGGFQARSHFIAVVTVRSVWASAMDTWRFGRWLLGTNSLWDMANRFYFFLLSAILGLVSLGAFAAASSIGRIHNVLLLSLDTLLPPIAARRTQRSSQANMETLLKAVTLIGMVPVLLVVVLLVVFAEEVLHFVYGGTYDEFASVLRIVSLASLPLFLSTLLRVALKSIEQTKVMFVAGATSALFLVTGGPALAAVAGVHGAAWMTLLNAVIILTVVAIGYRIVSGRQRATSPQVSEPLFQEG